MATRFIFEGAPVRGELIRRLGEQLRLHKADLATLVQLEAGKIESEALGEVQMLGRAAMHQLVNGVDVAQGMLRAGDGVDIKH